MRNVYNPTAAVTAALRDGTRELGYRLNDGIHVLLFWRPADDSVAIAVDDIRTGTSFEMPVPRDRALDAFNHPFAYAR